MNKIICTDVIKDGDFPMYIVKVYDLDTPVNFHSYDCLFFKQGRSIYELLKEAKQYSEETVPVDIEEAAWKYAPDMPSYNIGGGYLPPQSRDDLRTAFKDGAKWQKVQDDRLVDIIYQQGIEKGKDDMKEQMMKGAVEGEFTKDNRGNNVVRAGVFNKDFEYGDKVRIIIVKED